MKYLIPKINETLNCLLAFKLSKGHIFLLSLTHFFSLSTSQQRWQVRDFITRSRDFLNQLGCLGDFYFKNSISGFLGDFSELQVLNLVIKFLVTLAS